MRRNLALRVVNRTRRSAAHDAIIGFRKRHGLTADGVIDKATLAQLQVEPRTRVPQIAHCRYAARAQLGIGTSQRASGA